jgi:hypothetical protein
MLYSIKIVFFVQASSEYEVTSGTFYTFPGHDFCMFVNIPLEKFIYLRIMYPIDECSCTLTYLYQYWPFYRKYLNITDQGNGFKEDYFKTYMLNNVKTCLSTKSLIDSNSLKSLQENLAYEFEQGYLKFIFMEIESAFQILLISLACLTGMILNVLIVIAIHKNLKTLLKDKLYDYMSMNSLFNFAYCLVNSFDSISMCIFKGNMFCSSIYTTYFAQYFKIYFSEYLGSVLKICSNLTYV